MMFQAEKCCCLSNSPQVIAHVCIQCVCTDIRQFNFFFFVKSGGNKQWSTWDTTYVLFKKKKKKVYLTQSTNLVFPFFNKITEYTTE